MEMGWAGRFPNLFIGERENRMAHDAVLGENLVLCPRNYSCSTGHRLFWRWCEKNEGMPGFGHARIRTVDNLLKAV